jgi:hypothetical protein
MKLLEPLSLILLMVFFNVNSAYAEGWCELEPGYGLLTNGTKSDTVYISGGFKDIAGNHSLIIANGTVGKHNVALALSALMSGKRIAVYLDAANDTCANIPVSYSNIRHIKIVN